jgi:hypothetical protein
LLPRQWYKLQSFAFLSTGYILQSVFLCILQSVIFLGSHVVATEFLMFCPEGGRGVATIKGKDFATADYSGRNAIFFF